MDDTSDLSFQGTAPTFERLPCNPSTLPTTEGLDTSSCLGLLVGDTCSGTCLSGTPQVYICNPFTARFEGEAIACQRQGCDFQTWPTHTDLDLTGCQVMFQQNAQPMQPVQHMQFMQPSCGPSGCTASPLTPVMFGETILPEFQPERRNPETEGIRIELLIRRSLMSSRNDSRSQGHSQLASRGDETIPELHPELRRQDLQRSFSIFPEEVAERLKDFRRRPVGDYHIDVPDTKADDSGSSRPHGQLPVLVLAAGCGGIQELQEHVDASSVQWALLQFCVGEGTLKRQRLLFLHVNGQDCPPIARGRANELTASVQQLLREGTGQAEAFHASVEVKGPEEVTVERLLERVLPFFVVDRQEYSVQWLQSHYDRQLKEAQSPAAAPDTPPPEASAVHRSTVGESSAKRGTVFEMGSTSFDSGRDALKAVAEPMGAWNWVFFTARDVVEEDLSVVAGGIGSVEEMQSCYEEHPKDVLFGLLRMGFGQGRLRRTKYVFIHAIGDQVPAVTRGKRSAQRPKMEELMGRYASISVTMELLTTSDLTLKSVVDRVRRAVVVDDDVLDRDKATPSVFSMEAFQQALQEEKKSRMEEIRAQRKLRMEQSREATQSREGRETKVQLQIGH
eukprot:s2384_g2.t1